MSSLQKRESMASWIFWLPACAGMTLRILDKCKFGGRKMTPFTGELIGTALLILLGDGVVANVVLKDTKGNGSGWIVITFGWAMAVFVGVFVVAGVSGAHLNPAVTLALAIAGKFDWSNVPAYVIAQMLGAALGAFLVWVQYKSHFDRTENQGMKLAVFCTGPQVRSTPLNLLSEAIGTFVLVFGVLFMASPEAGLGAVSALPVALLVFAIGLSLGGTTGYAINPARDFAPRLMHHFLPIPNKRDSNWGYAWIAVVGPVVGGVVAALAYMALQQGS
jgi:glycerol uptake facilitator protein